MMYFFKLLPVLLTSIYLVSCSQGVVREDPADFANDTVYYVSFYGGKKLPLLPENRISKQDALTLTTYLKAEYDDQGKLRRLTKLISGNVWFVQETVYLAGRLQSLVIKDKDGNVFRTLN